MATRRKHERGHKRFMCNSKNPQFDLKRSLATTVPQRVTQGEEVLRHRLLKMLVTDLLPLSMVEHRGFRCFTQALNPTFDLLSSASRVRPELLIAYGRVKAKVKQMLASAREVTLTAETWTHASDGPHVTVTCHFINGRWKRRSCVLGATHVATETGVARGVVEQLVKMSSEWGVAEKVKMVVSNVASRGSMEEQCEARGWAHMRCFGYTLDVAFREAVAVLDDDPAWRAAQLLRKCAGVVRFFQRHLNGQCQLRLAQEQLKISPRRLIPGAEDSWLDVFSTLQTLLEQRAAVNAVMLQHVQENLWLNEQDVAKMDAILSALRPFKDAASEMAGEGYKSISNIIPLVTRMQNSMVELAESGNGVARVLSDVIKKHFVHVGHNRWMKLSTALDPRFKSIFLSNSRSQSAEHKLIAELKALSPSRDLSQSCAWLDEITDLLEQYKRTDARLKGANPLDFWRHPRGLEKLCPVALKYLTVVSTAVPLGRAFNREVSRRLHYGRCHLEPENVNVMLFLNSNWST